MEQYSKDKSLNVLIENAIKQNWNRMSLSDLGGVNYQYSDVARQIAKVHLLFESAGVKPGDKVAICGKNSANWAVVFLSCLTAGVVAVPVLHEFQPDMVHHLVNHSDAKLFFVDASIWENLDEKHLPNLMAAIYISDFDIPFSRNEKLTWTRDNINRVFGERYPRHFGPDAISYYKDTPDELCVINYTSGSTGMSKGVMLPYRSIWSNIRFTLDNLPFLGAGDNVVNMLPLAHMYGLSIEMLNPFTRGCHNYFLTRLPSPNVILGAFAEVKPRLIITVPLILEKIIRNKVFPMLEKPLMKMLLRLPLIDERLLAKVKENLLQAFGGNLAELIIGGAPLNGEVESFLYRIGFPVTVGYGMTECGPLLAYAQSDVSRMHTVGRAVDRVEMRIDSPDPATVPGNLWVKGCNIMLGYYKNDKATREVMPDDSGWMNTGDMCTIDRDGYITISGRSKTMILGPSGQNIYPEEIEQKLSGLPYVGECLVIDNGGSLEALVHPDFDSARMQNLDREALEEIMLQNLVALNHEMPAYSKVKSIKIMEEEFEKTPKRSIKRFLYQP